MILKKRLNRIHKTSFNNKISVNSDNVIKCSVTEPTTTMVIYRFN